MKRLPQFVFYGLVTTLISWGLYLPVVGHHFDWQWDKSGQFGDSFGALNTLFTGCAFVVVLATLIQQSAQIRACLKKQLSEFVRRCGTRSRKCA